jgi:hypothetical protein
VPWLSTPLWRVVLSAVQQKNYTKVNNTEKGKQSYAKQKRINISFFLLLCLLKEFYVANRCSQCIKPFSNSLAGKQQSGKRG